MLLTLLFSKRSKVALRSWGVSPWLIGVGVNQEPHEAIPGWYKHHLAIAPPQPTHYHGRTLDWLMACPGLGPMQAEGVPGSPMLGHTPALTRIPDGAHPDLGVSILPVSYTHLTLPTKRIV